MRHSIHTPAARSTSMRKHGYRRAVLLSAIPVFLLAGMDVPASHAAGVDPLPAVASALGKVTSYQVVVVSSSSGAPFRPSRTPVPGAHRGTPTPGYNGGNHRGSGMGFFGRGKQTRTIVAVRKGSSFEDYVSTQGLNQAGKTMTSSFVTYGAMLCTKTGSANTYTCQNSNFVANLDPTGAFMQGAGSTTFTRAGTKTIGGQQCDAYTYLNQSQTLTAKGTVYIAEKTNLPCEQDASITRKLQNSTASFTQTTISTWSRFNDHSLSVPAIPGH